MISRRLRVAILLVPLVCAGAAARQAPPSLSVSLSLPSVYPGDVVRADLRGASEADRPTGTVFGRDLAFAFDPAAGVWRTLIGIDLDTKPGAYPIAVKTAGDVPRTANATIRVAPKTFRVRRLKVAAGFVNPPAEALEQIARDARTLAGIFCGNDADSMDGRVPLAGRWNADEQLRNPKLFQRCAALATCGRRFHERNRHADSRGRQRRRRACRTAVFHRQHRHRRSRRRPLFPVRPPLRSFESPRATWWRQTRSSAWSAQRDGVTGPHLHWSVRLNGARVDPLSLIAATQQVRP